MKSRDIFRLSLATLLLSGCGQALDSVKLANKEKRSKENQHLPADNEEPTSKDRGLSLSLNLPSDVKAARQVSRKAHAKTTRAPLLQGPVATSTSVSSSTHTQEQCLAQPEVCGLDTPMPQPPSVEVPQAQVACFDQSNEALDMAIPAHRPLAYNTADAVAYPGQSPGSYYEIGGAVWAAPTLHFRLVSSPTYTMAYGSLATNAILIDDGAFAIPFLCQGQGVIKLSGLNSNRSYSIQAELYDAIGQLRYVGQASVMTVANTVQAAELRMQRIEYGDAQVLLDVIFEDEQSPDVQPEDVPDQVPPPVCLSCLDKADTDGRFIEFIKSGQQHHHSYAKNLAK